MANNRRKARKNSYLKQRGKKNKRFLLTAFGLVIFSVIGFYFLNSNLNADMKKLDQDIVSSKKKLENVKKEIDSLNKDYENRNTDQFKEKVAKEKLGMVKKSEVKEENSGVINKIDPNDNKEGQENNEKAENPDQGQAQDSNNELESQENTERPENTQTNENGR